MTAKGGHPADTPLYPIREVSRITGVNSVTLRAWERRYGLIRPQRTPKGHRLYAREDIERVERILQWLSRGVPVSQVKSSSISPPLRRPPNPLRATGPANSASWSPRAGHTTPARWRTSSPTPRRATP